MKQQHTTIELKVKGMYCSSCSERIEKHLKKLKGVLSVKVSYSRSLAVVVFEPNRLSTEKILQAIKQAGYEGRLHTTKDKSRGADEGEASISPLTSAFLIAAAGFFIIVIRNPAVSSLFQSFPQPGPNTGLAMIFVIGLLTSFHCLAMCGGISLSQTIGNSSRLSGSSLWPSFLYNGGRVISYTVTGAAVGLLGTVLQFSKQTQGLIQLFAGLLMVLMGIRMIGIFPQLRKLSFPFPSGILKKAASHSKNRGPLVVGLLNGLMPCGPLQVMQIYALSTGSPVMGAVSMLLFSLGTVPVMLAFGVLSSLLNRTAARRLSTVGAVLVVVMGISMLSRGIALTGTAAPTASIYGQRSPQSYTASVMEDGVQTVSTRLTPGRYEPIQVQAGVPVRWMIQADENAINGCNYSLVIPAYNLSATLSPGDNIIEFLPEETGAFAYSCWMGMIRSSINVVE